MANILSYLVRQEQSQQVYLAAADSLDNSNEHKIKGSSRDSRKGKVPKSLHTALPT